MKLVLFTPETPMSPAGHTAFREGDREEPGQDSVRSDTERNLVPRRKEERDRRKMAEQITQVPQSNLGLGLG